MAKYLPKLQKVHAHGIDCYCIHILNGKMTEAQADEIIRCCKAYEGLVREVEIEADGAKVLAEALIKAQKERGRLRTAIGLLNSMVLCGEKHSDKSKQIVEQALSEEKQDGSHKSKGMKRCG